MTFEEIVAMDEESKKQKEKLIANLSETYNEYNSWFCKAKENLNPVLCDIFKDCLYRSMDYIDSLSNVDTYCGNGEENNFGRCHPQTYMKNIKNTFETMKLLRYAVTME